MIDRARAIELLAQNVQQEVVARVLGCDASALSLLCSEDAFRAELAERKVLILTAATDRDARLDALEAKLLEKLDDAVDLMFKPRELLAAYQVLNSAKRRGAGADQAAALSGANAQVVNLQLPSITVQVFSAAQPQGDAHPAEPALAAPQPYRLNARGEVVEVQGRSLVTATPTQLLESLAQQKELANEPEAASEARSLLRRILAPPTAAASSSARALATRASEEKTIF